MGDVAAVHDRPRSRRELLLLAEDLDARCGALLPEEDDDDPLGGEAGTEAPLLVIVLPCPAP